MLNDIQALFLLVYSITYVTALGNWPPDTFATAAFFAKTEFVGSPPATGTWVRATNTLTKARLRFGVGTVFGSVIPLLYLGLVLQISTQLPNFVSPSLFITLLRTVFVGLAAIAPHAFHRFFLSFLLKYGPQLVDSTPRVTRYLDDRRGGVLTRPLHHVLGGLLQLSISVLSLLLLILTSGL